MKIRQWPMVIGALAASISVVCSAAETIDVSKASRQDTRHLRIAPAGTQYRPDPASQQPSYGRFIVRYRDGVATHDRASVEALVNLAASSAGLRSNPAAGSRSSALLLRHVRTMSAGGEVVQSPRALSREEASTLLERLRADPRVAYAQQDYFRFRQDLTPDDPRFPDLQWDMAGSPVGIGAPRAWEDSTGAGAVVAVLDTGVLGHQDLAANLVGGYDFVSWYGQTIDGVAYPDVAGDGDGRDSDPGDPGDWLDGSESFCGSAVADSSWHGTHVAGTIAAVANNGLGIAGAAYGARVQPVRVLGHCGGLTSDIADGIVWASGGRVPGVPENPSPAEVLNLSLGGYGSCADDPITQEAINGAISRGVTVVVAAGNSNMNAGSFSPASCDGVIAVGATGSDGARSYFSNYGPVVALSAPGGSARYGDDPDDAWIWSLGNSGAREPVPGPSGDILVGMAGTSMAAPHVSAVVALMQSASAAAGHVLSPSLVRSVLKATTKPFVVQPATTTPVGTGILDAAAAVAVAAAGIGEEDLAVSLTNRVATVGQSAQVGEMLYYRISIPVGVRSLSLRTYGGTGDASLYVARGVVPTPASHAAVSSRTGNTEAVVLSSPAPGIYYLGVQALVPTSDLTVLAAY